MSMEPIHDLVLEVSAELDAEGMDQSNLSIDVRMTVRCVAERKSGVSWDCLWMFDVPVSQDSLGYDQLALVLTDELLTEFRESHTTYWQEAWSAADDSFVFGRTPRVRLTSLEIKEQT